MGKVFDLVLNSALLSLNDRDHKRSRTEPDLFTRGASQSPVIPQKRWHRLATTGILQPIVYIQEVRNIALGMELHTRRLTIIFLYEKLVC